MADDGLARVLPAAQDLHHGDVGAEVAAPAHADRGEHGQIVDVDQAPVDEVRDQAQGRAGRTEGGHRDGDGLSAGEAEERLQDKADPVGQPGQDAHALARVAPIGLRGDDAGVDPAHHVVPGQIDLGLGGLVGLVEHQPVAGVLVAEADVGEAHVDDLVLGEGPAAGEGVGGLGLVLVVFHPIGIAALGGDPEQIVAGVGDLDELRGLQHLAALGDPLDHGVFILGGGPSVGEHHHDGADDQHAGDDAEAHGNALFAAVHQGVQHVQEALVVEAVFLLGHRDALFQGGLVGPVSLFHGEKHEPGGDDGPDEGAQIAADGGDPDLAAEAAAHAQGKAGDDEAHAEGRAQVGQGGDLIGLEEAAEFRVVRQGEDGGVVGKVGGDHTQSRSARHAEQRLHQGRKQLIEQGHDAELRQQAAEGAGDDGDGHDVKDGAGQQIIGGVHQRVQRVAQTHRNGKDAEKRDEAYKTEGRFSIEAEPSFVRGFQVFSLPSKRAVLRRPGPPLKQTILRMTSPYSTLHYNRKQGKGKVFSERFSEKNPESRNAGFRRRPSSKCIVFVLFSGMKTGYFVKVLQSCKNVLIFCPACAIMHLMMRPYGLSYFTH